MTQPPPPKIQLINTPDYRENYANSVQVRVNLWDFFLLFGRVSQTTPENVAIHNFQGVYVSRSKTRRWSAFSSRTSRSTKPLLARSSWSRSPPTA